MICIKYSRYYMCQRMIWWRWQRQNTHTQWIRRSFWRRNRVRKTEKGFISRNTWSAQKNKECEDGSTRIVCSLTSAINFRHENFYSCFPFDLFYLRKYKTVLFEAGEEEEEKKIFSNVNERNHNRNLKPTIQLTYRLHKNSFGI